MQEGSEGEIETLSIDSVHLNKTVIINGKARDASGQKYLNNSIQNRYG